MDLHHGGVYGQSCCVFVLMHISRTKARYFTLDRDQPIVFRYDKELVSYLSSVSEIISRC